MYLSNYNKIKKSLSEKAKDKSESILKSTLFENNLKVTINIFNELSINENVDLNDIKTCGSSILMFSRDNKINYLNKVFENFIKIYKIVP